MTTVARSSPAYRGQAIYGRAFLPAYDALVYGFNSPYLWRCPLSRLVAHYDAHLSGRHLDVGVASGKVLDEATFPTAEPELTLMDLNPNSLRTATARLARYRPRAHQANALEDWGLPAGSFDSVALTHVLHCLPGTTPDKRPAFEGARAALAPGGTFFGATILGPAADHNPLGRATVDLNNRLGVMSNRDDTAEAIDAELGSLFGSHELEVVGTVALWSARIG
ncbi:MAG TPA: class I SAM-dependent methyltransferase [Solirubrobacterales bacterium]|nr:class I SAM-dependent methyltransferase [Solirubrobacterales bacterium]